MQNLPKNYFLYLGGPIDDKEDENGFSNKLYLENLKNLIEEFNLKDRVFLQLGFIDCIKFFKSIDHYVIPSFNEGFGTSIVEAIAFGLPVTCNGNEKAFKDCANICNQTVLSSTISNPEEFAKDVIYLTNKVDNDMLKKSKKKIIKYCNENKINRIYKRLF